MFILFLFSCSAEDTGTLESTNFVQYKNVFHRSIPVRACAQTTDDETVGVLALGVHAWASSKGTRASEPSACASGTAKAW